ncbi:hypothetical protein PVT67_02875 [Gallaecimonas kandeliae]|uniref:hypothetical protein n=1 Tax=Gallaecimonas kandeliae TaxID=3029055 RepID=UPI0026475812|nr:hypothetical protein [Gallaecimonas kandeliae]WKE66206.1 hypothetical protein PVT67_02875 [Gallaecimonas kandeliae]
MEFFSFNSKVESATGQFNPLSFADINVANVALATYSVSRLGLAGALKHSLAETANAVIKSDLLSAVAGKLGLSPAALGRASLAALVVISGINIMAKYSSEQAKKELLARGLLAYSEI